MVRKKVKLAFVEADAARKSTYKKRKQGFLKKIHELSTLCGVDACAVITNPQEPDAPVVWPSVDGAQRVVAQYLRMPDAERRRRKYDHKQCLEERVALAKVQLAREQAQNRDRQVSHAMYGCLARRMRVDLLSPKDLGDVGSTIDAKLKEISLRMEELEIERQHAPVVVQEEPSVVAPELPERVVGLTGEEVGAGQGLLELGFGGGEMQPWPATTWQDEVGPYNYEVGPGGFGGDGASGSGSGGVGDGDDAWGGVPPATPVDSFFDF